MRMVQIDHLQPDLTARGRVATDFVNVAWMAAGLSENLLMVFENC